MTQTDFLTAWRQVEQIGATEAGGVERQAATEEDRQLRDWFRGFADERGWRTVVDGIGNLYALVDFTPGAPYILVGSHLDSQPRGGRFDGAYGVLAGLHAAERLQDHFAETGRRPATTSPSSTGSTRKAGGSRRRSWAARCTPV